MPTGPQMTQIAARAMVSLATVSRAYRSRVNPYSRARVAQAAAELGLPLPPLQ